MSYTNGDDPALDHEIACEIAEIRASRREHSLNQMYLNEAHLEEKGLLYDPTLNDIERELTAIAEVEFSREYYEAPEYAGRYDLVPEHMEAALVTHGDTFEAHEALIRWHHGEYVDDPLFQQLAIAGKLAAIQGRV